MFITTKDYALGNLGNPLATQEIISSIPPECHLREGKVGREYADYTENSLYDTSIRKVRVTGFDNDTHISKGMEKLILGCNDRIWKLPVEREWQAQIQYMVYDQVGDFFDWHYDTDTDNYRVLSISYCLSHKEDYEGAEIQIGDDKMKMDYGDFLVFPATVYHRVLPLQSGVRKVLVGWYR